MVLPSQQHSLSPCSRTLLPKDRDRAAPGIWTTLVRVPLFSLGAKPKPAECKNHGSNAHPPRSHGPRNPHLGQVKTGEEMGLSDLISCSMGQPYAGNVELNILRWLRLLVLASGASTALQWVRAWKELTCAKDDDDLP